LVVCLMRVVVELGVPIVAPPNTTVPPLGCPIAADEITHVATRIPVASAFTLERIHHPKMALSYR